MADQQKRKRQQALSKFTRNVNKPTRLTDDVAPTKLVKPRLESVKICWESREKAHNDYAEKVDDIQQDDDGGLG